MSPHRIRVLPEPQLVEPQNGFFRFAADLNITGNNSQPATEMQQMLQELLGITVSVIQEAKSTGPIIRFIELKDAPKMTEPVDISRTRFEQEGYILEIDENTITISSCSEAGAFYAVQTLRFLVDSRHKPDAVECCRIVDWPDFAMRGVTDDISRGQVSTIENFKEIIRYIARYKMNVYMPYIEDLFKFKSYPDIGKNRGALTPEECVELQEFASSLHVEIIPIFQTLGHWENLLFRDDYVHLADFPGAASLNAVSEQTYEFLEKLIGEIAPVFKSVYFHMGADESFDVGRGATRPAAKRHGLATVHARHYNRVINIIKKYDKKIMMYGDIVLQHPGILREIPRDVILFDWHYDAKVHYPSTEVFGKSGQPFIVSPGIQNWSRIFPDLSIALANITQFTRDGHDNGAIGAITSNWGDFGGANFRELNYYPYAFAANLAWNVSGLTLTEFEDRFFRDYYGSGASNFAGVYHLLSKLSEYYDIDHLFAHPFYPMDDKKKKNLLKSFELEHFGQQLLKEIDGLRLLAGRNQPHIDYLAFCARAYQWIGKLARAKVILYRLKNYDFDSPQKERRIAVAIDLLQSTGDDLKELRQEYQSLWLRKNRPDNLDIILGLMERVEKYIMIKIEEINEGNLCFNGRLATPFVSHPKAAREGELQQVFLRRGIHLDKKPNEAWLQIIANSHAEVWVNGGPVGHLFARRSLSGVAEQWRVAAWEISSHLKEGLNLIAVKVRNYVPVEAASANIWFEAIGPDKTITSDDTWKAAEREEAGWEQPAFDDSYWSLAVPVENRWIISRPYFKHHLPSRIEFFSETVDF